MPTLSANGRGHAMLTVLAQHPATLLSLHGVTKANTERARRQVWVIAQMMLEDHLITDCRGTLSITRAGFEALDDLNAGIDYVIGSRVTSVRVFSQGGAGANNLRAEG